MGELASAIADIVRSVCDAMLGLEVEVAPATAASDGPAGSVRFDGAWSGHVTVRCDADFARACAATLLDDAACDDAAVCDALGELTNMVAGNLKALLPAPSHLSLPCVALQGMTDGDPCRTAGPGQELEHVHFQLAAGHHLDVAVWRDPAPPRSDPPDRRAPADTSG